MTPLEAAAQVDTTMKAASRALQTATRDVLTDAGKVAKTSLENGPARGVTGGDLKFSNMGGARLGVKTRFAGPDLFVIPRGPWQIAERGRRPGRINHPGTASTQGRRSWSVGRERTYEALGRTVPDDIAREVEGAFSNG